MIKSAYFLSFLLISATLISGNWNPSESGKSGTIIPVPASEARTPFETPKAFKNVAPNYKSKLGFEENKGQWPNQVQFKSDLGDGRRVFFEKNKFTYTLYNTEEIQQHHEDSHSKDKKPATTFQSHAFEMVFVNANLYTEVQGSEANDFYYNYYIGNDPSKWASHVAVYKKLTYKNLYEGIDLVAYANENNFKYDYVVRAGAKAADIQLQFNGANKLEIHGKNLSIFTSVGEVVESIPYAYQNIDGKEVAVACEYKLLRDGQTVVFHFPQGYDNRYELIIDPVLVAATYSGATSTNFGHCATYDSGGNIYTGGRAFGIGYPTTSGAVQASFSGNTDICISKLNPTGSALLYATYLGGSSNEAPHSMFVNSNGELFVYGSTTSSNFATTTGAYDNSFNGNNDMIVSKFNSTGTSLLGSTYIGGTGNDGVNLSIPFNIGDIYRGEIIIDSSGDVFIAATTASTDFPVTSGAYDVTQNGLQDALVLKMNSSLTTLTWATYLGGTGDEAGCSLRLSQAGDIYIAGVTAGSFPTVTGALTPSYKGGSYDGFISRLNSSGSTLVNSTYIGTGATDIIYFIDIDVFGYIYVYGVSQGTFPISSGIYANANSLNFLQKIDPSLSTLIYSTMLGNGTKNTFSPSAFMVDLCQNIYMAGWGYCNGYTVTTSALQSATSATSTGFHLMVLGPGATNCVYATFFGPGGAHVDGGTSRFDPQGLVYQAVCEASTNFPTTSTAYSPTKLSTIGNDIAVFKIDFQLNCNALFTNATICLGDTAVISVVNVGSLLNATYSIQPGGLVSSSPFFTVSPSATTAYSVYVTGINGFSATVTNSGIATVSIAPSPQVIPSVTQAVCSGTFNAFNLNLSWIPSASSPSYVIVWQPIPNAVSSTTQTSGVGINAGVYNATVYSLPYGCRTKTSFTINPIPTTVIFSLTGPTMINCFNPTVTRTISPATYSYSWLGLTATYTGTSATFSLGQAGSWTVTATDPATGCFGTQVFTVSQDIAPSTSTVTPLTQNITCSVTSIITVTATSNPSVNISHYWIAPSGGTLTMNNNPATFAPGFPGTYTHVVVNDINGCSAKKEFTVTSSSGFPTFNVISPQNFTLGCSSKSTAIINIINGNTNPQGGAVTYTLIPPGASSVTPGTSLSINSTYTVFVPGTYTVITKDNTNLCESRLQVSVLQNTIGPDISANVPSTRLTCYTPTVVLEGVSTNTSPTSYLWSFPGNPGNVASNTILVISNSVAVTNTLIANYTLTITDDNNACKSTSIIAMEQNLFPPIPLITGASSITCNTATLVLTNQSSSSIPPAFPHPAFVQAYTWNGPSPQQEVQLNTTYIAATPGTYTLLARDLNNGCFAIGTKTIDDFRDYPEVSRTDDPFILDCGDVLTPIFPSIIPTPGLTYSWTTVQGATVSATGSKTLNVNRSGQYSIIITNTLNGCSSSDIVEVVSGSLQAAFVSDPVTGYAPLSVTFTNTSFSSSTLSPNANITTYWNFGNATSASSVTQNVVGPIVYTQAGTYTTTMYARKGECLDSSMVRISVEIPSQMEIPNIFSPNGDGNNDLFFLRASNLSEIEMMITDRWGKTVYELKSSTGNVAWDGTNLQGKNCAEGVYLYTLKATGKDASKYDKKGTITLVR